MRGEGRPAHCVRLNVRILNRTNAVRVLLHTPYQIVYRVLCQPDRGSVITVPSIGPSKPTQPDYAEDMSNIT